MRATNAVQVRLVKDRPLDFVEGFRSQIDALEGFFRAVSQDQLGQHSSRIELSKLGRGEDFLQSYLDILRVIYEPAPLAPFFLNGCPGIIADHIPESAFRFGYGSFVSDEASSFTDFYEGTVSPALKQYGYDQEKICSAFFAITVGRERYNLTEMSEVLSVLNVKAQTTDNVALLSSYENEDKATNDNVFAGMAMDSALEARCRLSIWVFCKQN
ncbi:MAG: hypothetical protein IME93_06830 [Proteobacteria bacterium]|nr:hypothetical protein [Pseudomonadota bacterium]